MSYYTFSSKQSLAHTMCTRGRKCRPEYVPMWFPEKKTRKTEEKKIIKSIGVVCALVTIFHSRGDSARHFCTLSLDFFQSHYFRSRINRFSDIIVFRKYIKNDHATIQSGGRFRRTAAVRILFRTIYANFGVFTEKTTKCRDGTNDIKVFILRTKSFEAKRNCRYRKGRNLPSFRCLLVANIFLLILSNKFFK